MEVLSFGSINIDKVYSVKDFVRKGETISALDYNEYPGGKGLNQTIAMARAGLKVCHAGKVGEDGLWLKELLEKDGVNTDRVALSSKRTGHAIIQVSDEGDNSIIIEGGANRDFSVEEIRQILADFDEGDVLVLQNELNDTGKIVDMAYDKGLKIVLNPSPITDELLEVDLNKIEYLVMNETESFLLSGEDTIDAAIETLNEKYNSLKGIITLGEAGSIYFDGDRQLTQAAFPAEVVDTTAAGDTFLGYFTATVLSDGDVERALERASRAAAAAVSKKGACASIPYIN